MAKKKPSAKAFAGLEGEYTFRFNGFNNDTAQCNHIVGLGYLTLDINGTVDGEQNFSRVALNGVEADKLVIGSYKLHGTFTPDGAKKFGAAAIEFKDKASGDKVYDGEYTLRRAGPDRFWLISKSLTSPPPKPGDPPDAYFENSSIEAVKVG